MIQANITQRGTSLYSDTNVIGNQFSENLEVKFSLDDTFKEYTVGALCALLPDVKSWEMTFDRATGIAIVPKEAYQKQGGLYFSLYGIKGDQVVTTECCKFYVNQSITTNASTDPHEEQWRMLATQLVNQYIERFKSGELQEILTTVDNQQKAIETIVETTSSQQTSINQALTDTAELIQDVNQKVDSGFFDGENGIDGEAATVNIGTVETMEPGEKAYVINRGTATDAILDMGFPVGGDVQTFNIDTLPVGIIVPFFSNSIPDSWLLCDGRSLLQTDYSELFAVIGQAYGGSAGTFQVPNLKERVPIGKGSYSAFDTLGKTGGERDHTLTIEEIPTHDHKRTDGSYVIYDTSSTHYGTYGGTEDKALFTTIETGSTGGNKPHNNMPPFLVVNHIIKASSKADNQVKVMDAAMLNGRPAADYSLTTHAHADLREVLVQLSKNPIGELTLFQSEPGIIIDKSDYVQLGNYYAFKPVLNDIFPIKPGFTRKYELIIDSSDNMLNGTLYIKLHESVSNKDNFYAFSSVWGSASENARITKKSKGVFDISKYGDGHLTIYGAASGTEAIPQMVIHRIYVRVFDILS